MRLRALEHWLQERPAWVLFVVAPLLAEVFSGSTPLDEFISPPTFLSLMMLYGSGAVLVREAVVRWRKGWPSLLLLGFAYAIYEEGLVVRSFFNPRWVDLGRLGVYGRLYGVNWVWVEQLVIFHAAVSILTTIAFVEILLPARRQEPWLRTRRAWVFHGANLLLVLALGWALIPYDAPTLGMAGCVVSILLLVVLGRRVPARVRLPRAGKPPAPAAFFFLGFSGMFLLFFIVSQGADEGHYSYPVAMVLLALGGLGVLALVLRWSGGGACWGDRHRFALLSGGLSFLLIFTALMVGQRHPVMYFTSPLFLLALAVAYRRVSRRVTALQA